MNNASSMKAETQKIKSGPLGELFKMFSGE